jgi:uncharacterized protein YyaL (SSP411 family)
LAIRKFQIFLLSWSKPGERYPVRSKAAIYLCDTETCSAPIEDPAAIEAALAVTESLCDSAW